MPKKLKTETPTPKLEKIANLNVLRISGEGRARAAGI